MGILGLFRKAGTRSQAPETVREPWRAEEERRRMEFNQKAGERFDDWCMFGDEKAVKRLRKMFK
ncbi:MAG: hypothetical protein II518_05680 [Candidatus Methanomethylophilus sp.]|nr:hypothetical protein [Methanomethylophilus sp.]